PVCSTIRRPPGAPLFPYTTLFRSFATGGSTINQLLNIPYWLCTLLVAAFIFIIAMYGTNVVRKAASTLSVLIIVGLVVVLVPNIDRKSTRLNSSHVSISYSVFCSN